jgi:ABC-type Fe3+/spermidine/putrescine transport system ATPase subunit
MFQDYALFPHLSVSENVAFGLRMREMPKREIHVKVQSALELVKMADFSNRRITDLSGGEQQRVALARALAPEPKLLMLDEPLAAMDRLLRDQLSLELHQLLRKLNIPALYVTHDQQEAFSIADEVLVLHEGEIIQSGKPQEIYSRPVSAWLASFFGMNNQVPGIIEGINPVTVQTGIGLFSLSSTFDDFAAGEEVMLVLRSAEVAVVNKRKVNQIRGIVEESLFDFDRFQTRLKLANGIKTEFPTSSKYPVGKELFLNVPSNAILCYKRNHD